MATSSYIMNLSGVPELPPFNPNDDISSLAISWKKWLSRLENLFVGFATAEAKRRKSLLLYYGGDRLNKIYATLTDTEISTWLSSARIPAFIALYYHIFNSCGVKKM